MSGRADILAAIGKAGSRELPGVWPGPVLECDLIERFTTEVNGLGAEVISLERLGELAGQTAFVDADVPDAFLNGLSRVDNVWEAEVGVTLADFGIADTGSLVLTAGPKRHRLASLAPPHHVAIVSKANILATSEEAFAALSDRTVVFVTGPSRTADIEGVIVRGIHGPRRLWVLLTP